MKRIYFIFCLIFLMFGLLACAREETPTATRPATAVTSPTTTPTPRPTATPTPTPEPTPIVPAVTASDQPLAADGRVTIDSVVIPEPGWLVVHAERDGQVAEVLAFTAVATGANDDVALTVDPLQATPSLVAMLHLDGGASGEFEFPGPDQPLQQDSAVVMASFALDFEMTLPAVTVADQAVGEDGLIHVDSVTVPTPGWLLILAEDENTAGSLLGLAPLEEGVNESVVVSIPWRQATPRLYAALHQDSGRPGRLDYPGEDLPLLAAGAPVVVPFGVTLPPDVLVLDQPLVEGKVVVERAISYGPGWLAVHRDEDGRPGLIIGSAPLADGVNEQIEVELAVSVATPQLHVRLHHDTEPGNGFNFPAADPPVLYDGQLPLPVTFRTNAGNYVMTRDQPLSRDGDGPATVTIPYVVTDVPAWVVVHAFAEGQRGDILGVSLVPVGISRDVPVELSAAQAGATFHAVLYQDAGTAGQFDFPNGPDTPLQRNRNVIHAPFALLSSG